MEENKRKIQDKKDLSEFESISNELKRISNPLRMVAGSDLHLDSDKKKLLTLLEIFKSIEELVDSFRAAFNYWVKQVREGTNYLVCVKHQDWEIQTAELDPIFAKFKDMLNSESLENSRVEIAKSAISLLDILSMTRLQDGSIIDGGGSLCYYKTMALLPTTTLLGFKEIVLLSGGVLPEKADQKIRKEILNEIKGLTRNRKRL
ncbi:MAG: hypothetical protein PHG05_01825 [Candidatus Nanoarchaeia archaeon]|nr:hypothetical protein [Candidatus Nanoarchaeia archaeon]